MKHRMLISAALGLCMMAAGAGHAGDRQAGKELADQLCASCHGPTGAADIPMYPILAGQHADYLLRSLRAYRSGERENAIMAGLVRQLSDRDMKNLAAYYASQDALTGLKID